MENFPKLLQCGLLEVCADENRLLDRTSSSTGAAPPIQIDHQKSPPKSRPVSSDSPQRSPNNYQSPRLSHLRHPPAPHSMPEFIIPPIQKARTSSTQPSEDTHNNNNKEENANYSIGGNQLQQSYQEQKSQEEMDIESLRQQEATMESTSTQVKDETTTTTTTTAASSKYNCCFSGCSCCTLKELSYWQYIGSLAALGSCLRVYVGRLFGEDCELGNAAVQDFLTPLSSKICVTAGGMTSQTGGALFRDLPANLLGSFIMGILTSHLHANKLSWFHKDHPLQTHGAFHTALGVGLCGCLTTFSSWNSQMVVMMDGTYTELGPQVVSALFGYILGIGAAVASFRFGREVSYWMFARIHRETGDDDDNDATAEGTTPFEDMNSNEARTLHFPRCLHLLPFASLVIVALSIIGIVVYQIPFYNHLLLAVLLAPFGAICRWKLAIWNDPHSRPRFYKNFLPWLPWGTLLCNVLGALVSIICQGINDRFSGTLATSNPWVTTLLFAIKVGFAGSLSTVSSMVKEIVVLQEKYPGHAKSLFYTALTCFSGMILGLVVYVLIIRIGR